MKRMAACAECLGCVKHNEAVTVLSTHYLIGPIIRALDEVPHLILVAALGELLDPFYSGQTEVTKWCGST